MEFTYALRFKFDATNNEAEYEALIAGLRIMEQMGVKNLQANKVRTLTSSFKAFSIRQILRSENKKVDALSKIASTSFAHLSKQVLVEELKEKSISEVKILAVVEEEGDTWMTPIFEYLKDETLPADVKKARVANYVLREIHEGSCSMHASTRSVVEKALRISYYWPTMHKDARALIRAYQDCQVHKPVLRQITCKNVTQSLDSMAKQSSNGKNWHAHTGTSESRLCIKTNDALEINLDLLEERREQAAIREAKSKARMEKYYNSKVKNTSFKPGDLVYRNNDASRMEDTGKLGPKWKGPYEVTEALRKGAYKLRDLIMARTNVGCGGRGGRGLSDHAVARGWGQKSIRTNTSGTRSETNATISSDTGVQEPVREDEPNTDLYRTKGLSHSRMTSDPAIPTIHIVNQFHHILWALSKEDLWNCIMLSYIKVVSSSEFDCLFTLDIYWYHVLGREVASDSTKGRKGPPALQGVRIEPLTSVFRGKGDTKRVSLPL
ncbi:reverse transcriptase domain-containing protein [Tanacetum coccineum]